MYMYCVVSMSKSKGLRGLLLHGVNMEEVRMWRCECRGGEDVEVVRMGRGDNVEEV